MTGAVAVLFRADLLLLLYGDMAQGFVPVLVALLFGLLIGLATYSQLMIRCPRCSTRITGLVDTRDGNARGSGIPPKAVQILRARSRIGRLSWRPLSL
jgi:hypothetical protein